MLKMLTLIITHIVNMSKKKRIKIIKISKRFEKNIKVEKNMIKHKFSCYKIFREKSEKESRKISLKIIR